MARPIKYSDESIIAALRTCRGLITVAADQIGCDPDTITVRAKKSKAVAAVLQQERERTVDLAELVMMQALGRGDLRAAEFLLRTLGKTRGYQERVEVAKPEETTVEVVTKIVDAKPRTEPNNPGALPGNLEGM